MKLNERLEVRISTVLRTQMIRCMAKANRLWRKGEKKLDESNYVRLGIEHLNNHVRKGEQI